MYQSPIEMMTSQIQLEMENELICRASQTVGYEIDRDELIRALKYDRDMYKKGYNEASEAICGELADLFGCPCNFSPMDEIMWDSGRCEDDCGKISEAECWKRYFEIKLAKES